MSGLLGFLSAGAAGGYAAAKNMQTEARNRVESAIIAREVDEMYQARRDERMINADNERYQRDTARDDAKFERDRAAKKEDFGMAAEHDFKKLDAATARDLKRLEVSHGYSKDLEGMRQSAADRRASIAQAGADRRAQMRTEGLLNTAANRSGGGFSQKEIFKANESDKKRIFDLQKELTDPLNARNAGRSELLKSEIRRLQDSIASRTYGDQPLKLDALMQ